MRTVDVDVVVTVDVDVDVVKVMDVVLVVVSLEEILVVIHGNLEVKIIRVVMHGITEVTVTVMVMLLSMFLNMKTSMVILHMVVEIVVVIVVVIVVIAVVMVAVVVNADSRIALSSLIRASVDLARIVVLNIPCLNILTLMPKGVHSPRRTMLIHPHPPVLQPVNYGGCLGTLELTQSTVEGTLRGHTWPRSQRQRVIVLALVTRLHCAFLYP